MAGKGIAGIMVIVVFSFYVKMYVSRCSEWQTLSTGMECKMVFVKNAVEEALFAPAMLVDSWISGMEISVLKLEEEATE